MRHLKSKHNIKPTITWFLHGFSGYIWLDTKIVLRKNIDQKANECLKTQEMCKKRDIFNKDSVLHYLWAEISCDKKMLTSSSFASMLAFAWSAAFEDWTDNLFLIWPDRNDASLAADSKGNPITSWLTRGGDIDTSRFFSAGEKHFPTRNICEEHNFSFETQSHFWKAQLILIIIIIIIITLLFTYSPQVSIIRKFFLSLTRVQPKFTYFNRVWPYFILSLS